MLLVASWFQEVQVKQRGLLSSFGNAKGSLGGKAEPSKDSGDKLDGQILALKSLNGIHMEKEEVGNRKRLNDREKQKWQ